MIDSRGNYLYIRFEANSLTQNTVTITLPDGYSYENIHILYYYNISHFYYPHIAVKEYLEFPVVNSKSPCKMNFFVQDLTKYASAGILITKFGQIPDLHYFDKAFDPILVTGDNGENYKVIPSNQFK